MKRVIAVSALCLFPLFVVFSSSVNAAAINTMYVDEASVTLDVTGLGSTTASSLLPSVEIVMGSYQDSIFALNNSGLNINIYSTSMYGDSAPSGDVNGTMINVDFSSLRAAVTYNGTLFDVELWPLTTELDYGSYNPATNGYEIGWINNVSLDVSRFFSYSATLDVNLSGHLTAVPLPAAAWLFGFGLISLAGFIRRKEK